MLELHPDLGVPVDSVNRSWRALSCVECLHDPIHPVRDMCGGISLKVNRGVSPLLYAAICGAAICASPSVRRHLCRKGFVSEGCSNLTQME
jgi:hypothetical protein